MAQDFRASILAQLDTKNIPNEIKTKIENQTVKFSNITFDKTQLINSIQSVLDGHDFNINFNHVGFNTQELVRQAQQTGSSIGQNITNTLKSKLSKINISHDIKSMSSALATFGLNQNSIDAVVDKLEKTDVAIRRITTALNKDGGIRIAVTGTDQLNNLVRLSHEINSNGELVNFNKTLTQNFAQQETQLLKSQNAAKKYISSIIAMQKTVLDQNAAKPITDTAHVDVLKEKFKELRIVLTSLSHADSKQSFDYLRTQADNLKTHLKALIKEYRRAETIASQLKAKPFATVKEDEIYRLQAFVAAVQKAGLSLESFKSLSSVDGGLDGLRSQLINATNVNQLSQYLNIMSNVRAEYRALKQEASQFASAAEVSILKNKMETWLNKNSKASKQYGDSVRQLIAELNGLSSQGKVLNTDLKRISNSWKEIDAAASAAGLKGRTFFQQIIGAAKSLTRYFGVSTFVYRTFGTIKNGIKNIVDLDTALVDLKKTTDGTEAQLNSFYESANDIAKQLGVTTKEVISSTAEWSRLGYSLKDAETMAQVSAKFEAISPGVDMEQAQNGLVSAMKAFNIEADEALDGIASKINAIGKILPKHIVICGEFILLVDNYIGQRIGVFKTEVTKIKQ